MIHIAKMMRLSSVLCPTCSDLFGMNNGIPLSLKQREEQRTANTFGFFPCLTFLARRLCTLRSHWVLRVLFPTVRYVKTTRNTSLSRRTHLFTQRTVSKINGKKKTPVNETRRKNPLFQPGIQFVGIPQQNKNCNHNHL